MIQDRNVHRDAKFLRRTHSFAIDTGDSQTDKDVPQFCIQPEWGWRLSGLSFSFDRIASFPLLIAAGAVKFLDAIGSPGLAPNPAAVTFLTDEFWHRRLDVVDNDLLRNHAGPTARAFSEAFTISDGFWGVFVVIIDNTGNISNIARSLLMEFPTEQIALDNCPQIPDGFGRVAIGTIQAVGGDFIAQTTNTDAALVAAFNTFDQYGFQLQTPDTHTGFGYQNAGAASFLKDPAGRPILQGRGLAGASDIVTPDLSGDLLVVTLREVGGGVSQIADDRTLITLDYRPWPVGGEGLGDVSVSQTPSTFVP